MSEETPNYVTIERKSAINFSPEFKKKKLCTHTLDVGIICDHGCLYCSTPTIKSATTKIYKKKDGYNPDEAHTKHIAHVDLNTPNQVKIDAKDLDLEWTDTIMICAKVDPYSPAVQELNLFRDSLKNLLETNHSCKIRILSKNAAIVDVLEDFTQYAYRIYFSLSITALPESQDVIDILEPNTSTIRERLDGIKRAKELGFTVYGMICPCIPTIMNSSAQIKTIVDELLPLNPEAIWFEPVNTRGKGFVNMISAFQNANMTDAADAIKAIGEQDGHDIYTSNLINDIATIHEGTDPEIPFHILVYNHEDKIQPMIEDDSDVIWLNPSYKEKKVYLIDVSDLKADREQPRKYFDKKAHEELKDSILKVGLINPIQFRKENKKLIVVAGERRFRAFKSILREAKKNPDSHESRDLIERFGQIPALYVGENHEEISLVENLQREDLNPIELASQIKKMKEEQTYDLDTIGTLIGKSMSRVYEIMTINKLPEEVTEEASKLRDVPLWILIECAKQKGKKAKIKKWEKLRKSGFSQKKYRETMDAENIKKTSGYNISTGLRFIKTASSQSETISQLDKNNFSKEDSKKLTEELEKLIKNATAAIESLKG